MLYCTTSHHAHCFAQLEQATRTRFGLERFLTGVMVVFVASCGVPNIL